MPNRNLICSNDDVTLDDIIRQIDNDTIESIDKIKSLLSDKIRIVNECLMSTEQQVRKLEYDITRHKYNLQKHAQSNDVVVSERKLIDTPVSYSSVNVKDFKSNQNLKSQSEGLHPAHTDKDNMAKDEKKPNGSTIFGCGLVGCASISNLILGPACTVAGSIFGVGMGLMKRIHNSKDSKKTDDDVNKQNKNINQLTKVNSAIYAPSEVNRDESIIIQVFVYKPSEEYKIAKIASEIDEDATRRNYAPLTSMVKKGDKIKFLFRSYSRSIEIEESSYEGIWVNELFKHEFIAYVPEDFSKSNFLCSINILINDIPVGDMKFKVSLVDHRPRKLWAEIKNHGYKKSFISYSHADAEKIRFLAEGFKIQGIDYFFDEHSLRTGDNYPKEIDEYISTCDVFVLCWSENAKSSEWVKREYNLALQRYDRESGKLKFYPISIVPKADLPSSLQSKFHFGIIQ